MYFRFSVGDTVSIEIWISDQIRGSQYPYFSPSQTYAGGYVESCDGISRFVIDPISIGVFENCDFICTSGSIWRWLGDFIKYRPYMIVDIHHFHAFGIRILVVLYHPKPSSVVKIEFYRLMDLRFC